MKTLFYIRNTKTDQNFDPIEMKFYGNNWEPQLEDDKQWLENIIEDDKEKFQDCIIEEVNLEEND